MMDFGQSEFIAFMFGFIFASASGWFIYKIKQIDYNFNNKNEVTKK